MTRIGALLLALAIPFGGGCSDDSDHDGSVGEKLVDGSTGEGGTKPVSFLPLSPDTVTIAVKQLLDVKVLLNQPAPQPTQVDVVSKDPTTVGVVNNTMNYAKWDEEKTTTIEGLKESTSDVAVEFTIAGTTETLTLKVKVVTMLPDAGPPGDV